MAIINTQELLEDGFRLAARLGATRGDQEAINEAITDVITKWDGQEHFVFVAALTQLARELIPPIAGLAKATSGIDFAKHCEAMLREGYDPREVADD